LKDLDKIDPVVRENVTFIPCRRGTEVLSHALVTKATLQASESVKNEEATIALPLSHSTRVRADAKGKSDK